MASPKSISLDIGLFENEKILQIFSQNELKRNANDIVLIWIKILCLSGKLNNEGRLQKGDVIYNEKMIANAIKSPKNLTKKAILVFKSLKMLDVENGVFYFPNWKKYQINEADKIREDTRKRVQKCREKKKQCNVTVTLHVTQENKETEQREREESLFPHTPISIEEKEKKDKEKRETPSKGARTHAYGEFENVLLTDSEYEKLKAEYDDCEERIERLSGYKASHGVSYKSDYATIRVWARKDKKTDTDHNRGSFDTDEFFEAALRRSYESIGA